MKKEIEIIELIIKHAKPEMQSMLHAVYAYCTRITPPGKEKLLERILFAFSVVDRSFFTKNPYEDTAISIGKGQTISQPSTVAAMFLHANIQEQDDILEIGTGSGWSASPSATA